jgi:hypothetical protein
MKPTQEQCAAYQQVFDHFNCRLFEKSLPKCMLSFSRRRHSPHTLFTAGQWRKGASSETPEISLNIKQMSQSEPIEVMATLVRQMVHLWQEMYGQPSSGKWYFNQEWADKMVEIGLIPSSTGLPGGKQIGQGIKHYIEPNGRFEQAVRILPPSCFWPFLPAALADQEPNRYTEKTTYQCIGCGAKLWGKGGMGMVCECGHVFADETGEIKPGLREKVYRILAGEYGSENRNQGLSKM